MKYTVVTLFPEIIDAYFASSIMAKAIQRDIIQYRAFNIRDYAPDRHKTCDDAPYGGGPGMLMLPGPLSAALEAAGLRKKESGCSGALRGCPPLRGEAEDRGPARRTRAGAGGEASPRVIFLSPSGTLFDQALARELAAEQELVLVCGRYEGIDQRVIDLYSDDEISVGDYILSSGEVAALAVIDATYRLVDAVITPESLDEESFSDGLLEYPQYTRPEIYDSISVPDILLSGHHENIRKWRLEKRVEKTVRNRPDLIQKGRELGLFNGEISSVIDRILAAQSGQAEGDTNDE
jgi:tRNA (guanine37-N1)-methyltransferase